MEATSAALSVLFPSITGMTSLSSYNDINDRRVTFTSTEDAEIMVLFYIEFFGDLFFFYILLDINVCPKIFMLQIWAIFYENTNTCERASEVDERDIF